MSVELEVGLTEGFSTSPQREGLRSLTIAELSEQDFYHAQKFPGFSGWANFDEFQLEREFLALGYHSAGVNAPRQLAPFAAFHGWSRLTGAPVDLDGLDEFAGHWRFRARHPLARTRGKFGVPGRPESHAVALTGVQIVVVREEVYARWRQDFAARAPFPAPDLDLYARQIVACCLSSAPRMRSALKNV